MSGGSWSSPGLRYGLGAGVLSVLVGALKPSTMLLISPFVLLGSAVLWVLVDLYITWWIDRKVLERMVEPLSDSEFKPSSTFAAHRRTVPPLIFTSPAAWSVTQTRASWEASGSSRLPLPSAPPAVSSSLDELFDLILRDFVIKWYSSISDSPAFPNAVERTIRETLGSVVERVGAVDWSDLLVGQILPLVTDHVDAFRTAEQALRGQDLRTELTESDELDLFLASRYASETKSGKLHQAIDVASPNSRPAEEAWLSGLIGRVLPLILPEREVESAAVRTIVREIVACAVLLPVIEMLSDPDFWNRMIDDKAGAAIRDQQMVIQFRQALDAQGSALATHPIVLPPSLLGHSTTVKARARKTEEISVKTPAKQFDSWVRGIGKCSNLADARRLRSDVSAQIRKVRSLVDGMAADEVVDGAKVADWLLFVERLYTAKRKADKRIAELGGQVSSRESLFASSTPVAKRSAPQVSLRAILLQPASLSYFMEFQERRGRSLRVQFWLLVEGLKDPLEDVRDEGEASALPPPSASIIATTRNDIWMIWDTYFSRSNSLNSNQKYLRSIKTFLDRPETEPVGAEDLRKVRHAVFAAQQDIFLEMEDEDFPDFVKSDLYFKAVAILPNMELPDLSSSPTLTRPRALSNPQTPLARSAPYRPPRSASPPPRPISPTPFSKGFQQLQLQRTDTAPPQVTLRAAFDKGRQRPLIERRSGSEGATTEAAGDLIGSGGSLFKDIVPPVRKTSITSLDSSIASLDKRRSTLTDSLEFLMGSPKGAPPDDFRSPLFGDEIAAGGPVDHKEGDGEGPTLEEDDYVQVQTIEAIQEALNSILATDARGVSAAHHRSTGSLAGLSQSLAVTGLRKVSAESGPPSSSRTLASDSPSIAPQTGRIPSGSSDKSIPLGGPIPRRGKGVFDDDEDMDEDEPEQEEPEFDPKSIRLAAPGDLQLPAEIARLASTLEKLRNQEAVVEALIRKAELTGIASELKILTKSRDSLRREMRALSFQKSQYESQESENKLVPNRTSVIISGTTIGQQADGQNFQLYLVEVHQLASDGTFGSGWIVTRRYSEFATLQAGLREKYIAARGFDFPSKRLVTSYNEGFIEQRRRGLEKYLQALVRVPVICQSIELRTFLSQQNISLPSIDLDSSKRSLPAFPGQGLVRSFYRSVVSGIDDILDGTGTSSMMDTIIQRLSQQAAELSGLGGAGVQDEDLVGQLLADDAASKRGGVPLDLRVEGGEGLTYFTKPICDLFVTVFELKEKNNWLRRQAILIILQQILGGTIERKFRDAVKTLFGSDQLVSYISSLKNGLWPGGNLKPKEPPRTSAQKAMTKDSAHRKLSALMPDIAANLIGRANARQGARRLFAVLQNRRLNRHLIYSIIDAIFLSLFPELSQHPSRSLPASFSSQTRYP